MRRIVFPLHVGAPLGPAFALALALAATLGCGGSAGSGIEGRIDAVLAKARFGTLNRDEARRIYSTPPEEDGPFFLVNLIRHRARAEYPDGRETDLTGAEADAIYGSMVLPALARIGAQPVFVANDVTELVTSDGSTWDQVAIVRYPSRAKFIEMIESPDFPAAAIHKQAGVERSTVIVAEQLQLPLPDALLRVDLATVPFPPTAEDPPVVVVNVLDYADRAHYDDGRDTDLTGREAFGLYEQARAPQAFPIGARPGLWLGVEAELYGDGTPWEEVRLNNFPSLAALEALTTAEALDAAGIENRKAGLDASYGLLARPLVHLFGYAR